MSFISIYLACEIIHFAIGAYAMLFNKKTVIDAYSLFKHENPSNHVQEFLNVLASFYIAFGSMCYYGFMYGGIVATLVTKVLFLFYCSLCIRDAIDIVISNCYCTNSKRWLDTCVHVSLMVICLLLQ